MTSVPRRELLTLGGCCLLLPVAGVAQVPPVAPLPAVWQTLGITQWPFFSAQLELACDEIVLAGSEFGVQARSALRFTQMLALFSRKHGNAAEYEPVALTPAGATDKAHATLTADTGRLLSLLAKTPYGWFRTDRDIKVGRPARPPAGRR